MIRNHYPEQPHIVPMEKDRYGNIYYTAHEYRVDTDDINLLVFEHFRYDGASVPRWAWSISGLRPDGLLRAAALIHDIIYLNNGSPTKIIKSSYYQMNFKKKLSYTRKDADKLFLKIMLESGVKKWRAKIAYRAVRIGGRFLRNF